MRYNELKNDKTRSRSDKIIQNKIQNMINELKEKITALFLTAVYLLGWVAGVFLFLEGIGAITIIYGGEWAFVAVVLSVSAWYIHDKYKLGE